MGTFEKLGVLVIVVIIVMIMAVAIYQWGGAGQDGTLPVEVVAGQGEDPAEAEDGPDVVDLETLMKREEDRLRAKEEAELMPLDVTGPRADGSARKRDSAKKSPRSDRRGVPRIWVVRSGDRLSVLVRRWGLKQVFLVRIRKANPKINLDRLSVGDRLVIPDPKGYFRGDSAAGAARGGGHRLYKIREGDDLWTIARTHLGRGSRFKEILRLNPKLNPSRLKLGTAIRLPAR